MTNSKNNILNIALYTPFPVSGWYYPYKTHFSSLVLFFVFNESHLQWTIMGPAPSWLAAADFRIKSSAGYSQPKSGAPWSGQPVKWYWDTIIGFTSSSVASWTKKGLIFNNSYYASCKVFVQSTTEHLSRHKLSSLSKIRQNPSTL